MGPLRMWLDEGCVDGCVGPHHHSNKVTAWDCVGSISCVGDLFALQVGNG